MNDLIVFNKSGIGWEGIKKSAPKSAKEAYCQFVACYKEEAWGKDTEYKEIEDDLF